jgi:hypothetical protein
MEGSRKRQKTTALDGEEDAGEDSFASSSSSSSSVLTRLWRDGGGISEDIFVSHVLPKLNLVDTKLFREANRATRAVVRKHGGEEMNKAVVSLGKFSSISTLEYAWCVYPFGKTSTRKTRTKADFLEGVAKTGSVELVRWANEVRKCVKNKRVMETAAKMGHVELLKFTLEKKWPGDRSYHGCPTVWAARFGHLECCEVLLQHNAAYSAHVLYIAITHGHLPIVRWYLEQKFPCDFDACACAAYHGKLHILRFLHERGVFWDDNTCRQARVGQRCHSWRSCTDCLEYAKQHGCPDDPNVNTLW